MFDIKNFTSAIAQIAEEKGISADKVIESIETAIAAAYKKDYGKKGQVVRAKLDAVSGQVKFWQIKLVVSDDMIYSEEELEAMKDRKKTEESTESVQLGVEEKVRFNPERHIMLEDARKVEPKIKGGEELEISLQPKEDYGRIAAQTAKQVILQKIREAERDTIFDEYKSKEGEILSGSVQRIEGRNVYVDIGKTFGILPKEEQVPGEFYRIGQRLRVYLLKVDQTPKGPMIFLSRAYPKIITKLFELEVPEISQGTVEIRGIAREAGSRSKIAVESKAAGVDPIGSAVGQRGTRVMAVINELGGEKIDIVEYADDPQKFIANALSPAKVLDVRVLPKNKALCIVPEDQLSLAIGKDGQNVRLAAKLTGWKIDVRTPETATAGIEADVDEKLEVSEKTSEGEEGESAPKESKNSQEKKNKKENSRSQDKNK